ncbi:hypothetical protein K469DRAFT_210780 [Zopfia rhizophila CBS 207.26]|uniref:Uncharacterized protein n=1 Tax=Zopfia rhizophila CBS 207.26 TaxID=1314779 RepID=A0A6A6DUT9_9PEZI|nr:hypothetical protein K469DRAFT_210780 [Zopfia rhizophila CBS 207.26]
MMRPSSFIRLATTLSFHLSTAHADIPLNCAGHDANLNATCQTPLEDITVVTPGAFIIAKLPCFSCPTVDYIGERGHRKHFITHEDNALFFNITLSERKTSLLLNDRPIFPTLPSPPPSLYASQVTPNFSLTDLANSIACTQQPCKGFDGRCFCIEPTVGSLGLSYDYAATQVSGERDGRWQITFDAIGGHDGYLDDPVWVFNRTAQKMLQIVLKGVEIEDVEVVSDLFELPETKTEYRLEIISVELVERSYDFPSASERTAWETILFFFGLEARNEKEGHVVRLWDEWDSYGRKGTLKHFLHGIGDKWHWELFLIIVGSVAAGVAVLYGVYKLIMLEPKRQLEEFYGRRDTRDNEGRQGLLDGHEEEEDEMGHSVENQGTTHEAEATKPLPPKPLPEKPLPEVPLLDDV